MKIIRSGLKWLGLAGLLPAFSGSAALLVGSETNAATDIRRDAVVEATELAMPSVVNVITATLVERRDPNYLMLRRFFGWPREQQQGYSVGSGVIIDEDGYFITNLHVLENATHIQVKLSDGRVYDAEPRVATANRDVALLKIIGKPGEKFKAIKMAKDDDLLLGETVLAIGNPYGLGGSVSRGILSSKSRRPAMEDEPLGYENWLQTDAAINPGNSGGALLNLRGELIGINVAVYREDTTMGMGVGFAIPVKQVAEALSDFFTPEYLRPNDTEPMWFGARIRSGPYPLFITQVQKGSPADKAGLKVGQIITAVNGRKPKNLADCVEAIVGSPKQTATLQLEDAGTTKTAKVQLVKFENFFRQKLGMVVDQLSAQSAANFGLKPGALTVRSTDAGGSADASQLQPGFLILELDGTGVSELSSAAAFLDAKKSGDKVRVTVGLPSGYGALRRGTAILEVR